MSTHRTVNLRAADKRGATLDELSKFVAEAQNEGVGPTSRVKVQVSWGGKIKTLQVEDETTVTPDRHGRLAPEPARPFPAPPRGNRAQTGHE